MSSETRAAKRKTLPTVVAIVVLSLVAYAFYFAEYRYWRRPLVYVPHVARPRALGAAIVVTRQRVPVRFATAAVDVRPFRVGAVIGRLRAIASQPVVVERIEPDDSVRSVSTIHDGYPAYPILPNALSIAHDGAIWFSPDARRDVADFDFLAAGKVVDGSRLSLSVAPDGSVSAIGIANGPAEFYVRIAPDGTKDFGDISDCGERCEILGIGSTYAWFVDGELIRLDRDGTLRRMRLDIDGKAWRLQLEPGSSRDPRAGTPASGAAWFDERERRRFLYVPYDGSAPREIAYHGAIDDLAGDARGMWVLNHTARPIALEHYSPDGRVRSIPVRYDTSWAANVDVHGDLVAALAKFGPNDRTHLIEVRVDGATTDVALPVEPEWHPDGIVERPDGSIVAPWRDADLLTVDPATRSARLTTMPQH